MSSVIVYTQSSWLLHCKLLCRSSVSELPARGVASCNRRATADMDGGLPPEGCAAVPDPSNRPASPGFCERLSSACVMIRCPGVAASGVPGVPVPLRPPPVNKGNGLPPSRAARPTPVELLRGVDDLDSPEAASNAAAEGEGDSAARS